MFFSINGLYGKKKTLKQQSSFQLWIWKFDNRGLWLYSLVLL